VSGADVRDLERRLRWQCRRGLLELDLLLTRFLDERYAELGSAEQGVFGELLQQPDAVLLRWFQGQETPPSVFEKIVRTIV